MRKLTPEKVIENFCSRFQVTDSGCWEWTAGKNQAGYGYIWDGSKGHRAHRWAYKFAVDPDLPDDLTLDHLCRNKACVNPDHLEAVTVRVNVLRSEAPSAVNAQKSHCKHGHEFTPENTRVDESGHRGCRTCLNTAWRRSTETRAKNARKRTTCPDCGQAMSRSSLWRHRRRHTEGSAA